LPFAAAVNRTPSTAEINVLLARPDLSPSELARVQRSLDKGELRITTECSKCSKPITSTLAVDALCVTCRYVVRLAQTLSDDADEAYDATDNNDEPSAQDEDMITNLLNRDIATTAQPAPQPAPARGQKLTPSGYPSFQGWSLFVRKLCADKKYTSPEQVLPLVRDRYPATKPSWVAEIWNETRWQG
jgi:hypothetical protein